jgi:hypothetical protein
MSRPSMIRSRVVVVALALSAGALPACNLQEFTVNTTAPVLHRASLVFGEENDVQLAREAAPGQLKTADGFLASSPENRLLLEVLARGYLEYAFGFLEDELEAMPDDNAHHEHREALAARASNLYDRARGYAMRHLQTFGKGVTTASKQDLTAFEAALAQLPKEAAPGLLCGGMAWASAINLNRADIARVAELPKAVAMVQRAYVLDKAIMFGAAPMTLGLVKSSQGKAMGGDPDAARKYFEEAIALHGGNYLLAKVMMARFYAVITQDRPLFEKLLGEVAAAPADALPSARLPNELAKRRAARYLKTAEELF